MKKTLQAFTKSFLLILFLAVAMLNSTTSNAQVTLSTQVGSTGYTGGNGLTGNTGITFAIENNSGSPYYLSELSNYFQVASNGATVKLWYSATSLSGATPSVNSTDWSVIATNPSVSVPADGIVPVFSGLTFVIPNGTTYRFCIESSTNIRYSGTGTGTGACTPNVFTQNGISLRVGESQINAANIGYSVTFTSGTGSLGNTPRWFTGTVTLNQLPTCTAPPTAGSATASSNLVCPSTNFELNLSGSSIAAGLTYQWEKSSDSIAWSDITLGTTQKYLTSLTSTTYYRCKVTCNAVTVTSTPVKVSPRPILAGGTYTINPSLPNSSTNFNSFTNFVTALSCGVTGPIEVNVQPGTYVGTLNLQNIPNTSAVNTVTIKGNGAKLIDTLKAGKPDYILQIRGSNYITIDSMILEAHSTSTKGFVVSMGEAHYNTIKNCKIIGDQNNTGTTFGGIIISGSSSSYTATTTASYNVIEKNDISGGYFGISAYGTTTIANMKGNVIKNNIIRDYYIYGVYIIGTDSTQIIGNDINRKLRSAISTGYGIYSATAGQQLLIKNNKIHDLFPPGNTSAFYGIYFSANDGAVGKENKVVNNAIYNINTGGAQYCIYNTTSDYCQYYYNTVYIDNPTATAGLCYGFYQTTVATNLELRNNIFSISKGGSGAKYALYFNTATTLPNTNYNDLYVNTSVTGSGVKNIAFHSAARVTLADWQAYSAAVYDQNSISVEPSISGTALDNVKPNAPTLNNMGTPLASVIDDIVGAPRDLNTPDMGAMEFTPAQDDAGITTLVSPSGICPGTANVSVKLKNFGASAIGNVNINWTVNNVAQPQFLYSGNLLPGADTTLQLGTINVVANTVYNLKIYSSNPNGNADANLLNDTLKVNGIRTGLVGTITVGGVGADFANLTDLVTELNLNGVCGPVIVNVNPSAGPFTGPFTLQNVKGINSTNTLVFNGNGAVINTNSHGIVLNKVSYFTMDSFVINVNGSAGIGIQLVEGDYNTFKRNKVVIGQDKTATTFSAIAFSGSVGSATTAGRFRYNTIENNQLFGGYYELSIYGNSSDLTSAVGNVIRNNKIFDGYVYSTYTLGTDSLIMENNEISRARRTLNITTFYGLYASTGTRNAKIRNNKVHSIYPAGYTGTATAYLMYTAADATLGNENIYYNNAAYNIGGSGSVYGIYSTGSDGAWYYNNTIDIGGTGAGTIYAVYQITAATNVRFINNTLNINRISGTGTRILMNLSQTASTITSNYNHFNGNAGVNYGQWGTALSSSLSSWKSANSGAFDQNSIDGNALFNGTKNVIPKIGSPLIGAGTNVAFISTDILGATRNFTPTIGAYEQAGDFSGPSITFAPILNTVSVSNYVLNSFATITDPANVDTNLVNRPRMYYRKSTDLNRYVGNSATDTGWKYVVASNNVSPFNFTIDYSKLTSAADTGDKIEYFIVAQDANGYASTNANVFLNDDPTSVALTNTNFPVSGEINSYRIGVGLSGTIQVGTGAPFTTLTGAGGLFEHINNNLLGGDLNIVVKSNLTENGSNALIQPGEVGGSNYKIKITPINDTLRTISGAFVGGLIRLNGVDRVTIDGSYNGQGQFLKIENTTTTSGSAGIQIISSGNNAGATDITIKNAIVMAGTAGNSIPIHIGGATIPYSPGASNNKIKILNNTIMRGSVGIFSGSVDGFESDSLVIENNTIGSTVTAEQIRLYGIALEVQKNAIINNNVIKNIINTAAQQSWGIATYDGFKNGKITNNKIEKVSSGSGAFGGRGIEIISGKSNENIFIANNFIGEITGPGARFLNSTATMGIGIIATRGVEIYNNSVNLTGPVAATTTIPDTSAAMYVGPQSGQLNIRNNSFVNTINNASDTSVAYAFHSVVGDTAFVNINYNNYHVGSTNTQGKLGHMIGNNLTTLAQIQTATLKDLNSISGNPNYISNTDLHAQGATLYQKGVSIPSVPKDIDGDTRSATVPSIGADEFNPPANDIQVLNLVYPKALSCGKPVDSIGITLLNLGTAAQTGFNVRVNLTGAVTASLNKTFAKNLAVSSRDTIYLGTFNSNVTGVVNVEVFTELLTDAIKENDTLRTVREFNATPAMPSANDAMVCKGDSTILVATNGSLSYTWWDAPVGGNLVSADDTLKTPVINSTRKYWVETAAGATTGAIKITEIDIGGTDMIEIQNLGQSPVNTAGWKVIVSDSYTVINAVNTIAWQLPAQMAAGQILYKTDGTTDNYWGNNLFWNPGAFPSFSGWAIILDNNDAVVDAVFMNWPATNIAGANIVYNSKPINITNEWSGNGIDITSVAATNSVSRAGNKDNNNSTDFQFPTTTKNATNSVIVLPYTSGGCPSDRKEVTVTLLPAPAGSTVAQSTPFQGTFNAGTPASPDGACLGDTLTYVLTPPTGFNLSDLGVTWTVNNAVVKTTGGATPAGSITMNGLSLRYVSAVGDLDSTLVFNARVESLLPNGCDTLITRYLKLYNSPIVNLGADKTVCAGTSVTIDAGNPGSTYLWSTGETTQTISVLTAGTYTVKVTSAAGCEDFDTLVVNTTAVPVVNLGQDLSVCPGTPITLDAGNPGLTYLWSTGATTQTLNVVQAGTYIVTVTNGTCSTKDTIVVSFKALPVVNLGADLNICTSDTVTLDAGNTGSTYLWSTGATTKTIRVSKAGTYSVEVTNAGGCKSTDAVVVTNKPEPISAFTSQGINSLNVQFNATPQNGSTYAWNFGDPTSSSNTSSIENPIHEFTAAGTFFVTLTVTNVATGCVSVNVDTVVVNFIGVSSVTSNKLKLAAVPNPFVGNTKIEYELTKDASSVTIEVFDVVGRKVASLLNNESQLAGKHSIKYVNEDKELGSGVYIVQLTVDGKTSIIRMIDVANK